jgi:hypothetical protein
MEMMKMRFPKTALLSAAASALLAGSAQAGTIAGWDFSQYLSEGLLTTDGATGADTLSANYSNLDPTAGAGAESAAYGTMYVNGQFGSTAVDPFAATPIVAPVFPSLASNLNAPTVGISGTVPFDSLNVVLNEGQTFANTLGLVATAPVNVVFKADLSSDPRQGSGWGITFGGKTQSGTSVIGVSYSLDGLSYGAVTNVNLDSNDTPFGVSFGPITADVLYVRLSLATANGLPIVDNVSLNATLVPEPGTLVLLGAGLAAFGLRRRYTV